MSRHVDDPPSAYETLRAFEKAGLVGPLLTRRPGETVLEWWSKTRNRKLTVYIEHDRSDYVLVHESGRISGGLIPDDATPATLAAWMLEPKSPGTD